MTKTEIVSFVKDVRQAHDVKIAAKYVAKETGKSLMLDTDKTKLDGIDTGAQVNVVEGVSISGGAAANIDANKNAVLNLTSYENAITSVSISGGAVQTIDENKNVILDLSNYALKTDIATALQYKGTVESFGALPTTNLKTGDVYNITNAGGTDASGVVIRAGDNVAYNGSGWDVLAGTVDLSGYVETETGKSLVYDSLQSALVTLISGSAEQFTAQDVEDVFTDD